MLVLCWAASGLLLGCFWAASVLVLCAGLGCFCAASGLLLCWFSAGPPLGCFWAASGLLLCWFSVLGCSWAAFVLLLGCFCAGSLLGCLWAASELLLGCFCAGSLCRGLSGESLGLSLPVWTCLGAVLTLGSLWKYMKPRKPKKKLGFLMFLAPKLSLSWLVLGQSWAMLGLSWAA